MEPAAKAVIIIIIVVVVVHQLRGPFLLVWMPKKMTISAPRCR